MKVPATLSDPKGPCDFTFYIPFPSLDMFPVQAAPLLTQMLTGQVVGTAIGEHMKKLLDKMDWHHVPICENLKAARSFAFFHYKPFAAGERITNVCFATYVFVFRAKAILHESVATILGDDGSFWVDPLHCFHNVVDQTLLSLEGQQIHITSQALHDYDIWVRFNTPGQDTSRKDHPYQAPIPIGEKLNSMQQQLEMLAAVIFPRKQISSHC